MANFLEHTDLEVQSAITQLCDRLAEYERKTGRRSVLILREQGDFYFRAQDGKPIDEDLPLLDKAIFLSVLGDEYEG